MLCTRLTVLTNLKSKVCRGRCGFYNTIVEASNCKGHTEKHGVCFKIDLPDKK